MGWPFAKIYLGRTLIVLGVAVAALNFICFAVLAVAYAKAPSVRDPSSGHTHPFSNHGFVHYLDGHGQFISDTILWLPVLTYSLILPGMLILSDPKIVADIRGRWISRNF